jgi:hypothetical protein
MADLFISIILAGFAVTFVVELLSLVTSWFFQKETLYAVLSLPLSFGAMYVMYDITDYFFVTVPATAFIALILKKYLNTKTVTSTRLNRL